ncbi:hypothetical protein WA026_014770 [Henosepilachna vigintioctopunctata]|uniref:Glycoprotein-N-acetylgalactosamine 3-beta-galactosyltransferase 1 n=1 Tax=Henosepilachna vigintioctopunctata TaxID=420089 RepID=A0AAW1UYM2_9CUCU
MLTFSTNFIFIVGFISGSFISLFIQIGHNISISEPYLKSQKNNEYENWFRSKQYNRKHVSFDLTRYGTKTYYSEAELLFNSISVLCLVIVSKDSNWKAIQNTWGKRCNGIDSIKINKKKEIFPWKRNNEDKLWITLCEVFKKVERKYNWVLVVNDDTFAIIENLRYHVAYRNSSEQYYIGYPVKFWSIVYNLGRAGYLLSRGVLEAIQKSDCNSKILLRNREDFILGNHLSTLNISAMYIEDEKGLSLFYPYNLNRLLFHADNSYKFEPVYESRCCSKYIITFNAIDAEKMYKYYYMLYTLQVFYSGNLGNRQAAKPPDHEVWQKFLRDQNLPLNISNEKYYDAWEDLIDSPDSFGRSMKREDYSDNDD